MAGRFATCEAIPDTMKAHQKLSEYRAALARYFSAVATNNPFMGCEHPEPKPADFGIKSAAECFVASKLREQLNALYLENPTSKQ